METEQPGPGKELFKNTAQNQLKRGVPADQSLKYLSTECSDSFKYSELQHPLAVAGGAVGSTDEMLDVAAIAPPGTPCNIFALANRDPQGLMRL